jgi:hypothetical protein
MSTQIESNARHMALDNHARLELLVTTREGSLPTAFALDRASFLAAVAAECGVIIIDRADLPETTYEASVAIVRNTLGARGRDGLFEGDTKQVRDYALSLLAAAEYLDAHPPVDEADVEALARVLDQTHQSWDSKRLARHILATGHIEVKR